MKKYLFFALIAITALLTACTDDDSFSASSSNVLTFSTDSVKLDTVFSRVPTATKTFWVYNKSGDGIRCSTIKLQNGNQTGFRVNVDGSYLGEAQGFQVNNIEIRKNDSIRVFVELTSPSNNQELPQEVKDDLVFVLESGVQQKVVLNAFTWDAEIMENNVVTKDSTINSTKPIIIRGGLTVAENATLTIAAGTSMYFHGDSGMDVYGSLVIDGTADKRVVMRGDRIDRMFDYLPYDNVSGQWKGIHIYSTSNANYIRYADIHSTFDALICDTTLVEIDNTIIHNCQGYGFLAYNSVIMARNSQFTNTLNDCVAVYGGEAHFIQCTMAQFYPFDYNRGVALRFSNFKDDKDYPLTMMSCINTLITGYADDEILGTSREDSDTPYLYYFDHCIIRTPVMDEDPVHLIENIYEQPEDTVSGGVKHFALIDTNNLVYDFQLSEKSSAIDKGTPTLFSIDLLGRKRDDTPDIGCYEFFKPAEEQKE
ncbi:MAG: right-handed parallel beta-helix repeat-containing protein [Prevotella sp.]|nr:right-handed parallel beta-helix repeat-containing protein [Prevotella sp.]